MSHPPQDPDPYQPQGYPQPQPGYPQPGYPPQQPGYPPQQPGYPPQQPGYPPPGYGPPFAPPATGALSWGLGLLVLFPIPFVGSLAAGIAMVVASRAQVSQGPLARVNATRAGNWGLTYLLGTVLLVGAHFVILASLQDIDGFFPFGIILCTWLLLTVVHLVLTVVGLVQANGRREVRVGGIPFYR
ncbi:hypothetical protein IF650_13775 [Cellulosimicrobium terreum]|nr:hypothetical protein [Cellulosimicrobium terreum]